MAFASPGSRLIAYIIDGVIQALAVLLLVVLTIVLGVIFFPVAIVSGLAIPVLYVGYFPYFWAHSGQTPGMAAMKIKVVRDADGGPITVGSAILRVIGLWIGLSVFYIGVIWIFFDKRKRGWQDLIGGTVVIDVPPTLYTS
jgi:Predicted membrane protein/domain